MNKSFRRRLVSNAYRWFRACWTLLQGLPKHASLKGDDLPNLAYRVWDQGKLLLISGLTPTNYYRYRLYRADLPDDRKAMFIGFFEGWRWLLEVNGQAPALLVTDKIITSKLLAGDAIPRPECLGVFGLPLGQLDCSAPERAKSELRRFLSEPHQQDFFLKPVYGRAGAGHLSVGHCIKPGTEWELLPEKGSITADALIEKISSSRTAYLAQRRLIPHEGFACFGTDTLHTVRFITLLDGDVHVVQAALKIATGAESVDNMSKGNIVAGIDMETGTVGAGYQFYDSGKLLLCRRIDRHPRTDCRIAGQQIPLWQEAVKIVKRAAACFYLNSVVAWDIALTTQGPLVIEANSDPNWLLTQLANDEGLLETRLGDYLYRHRVLDKIGVGIGLKEIYERHVAGGR